MSMQILAIGSSFFICMFLTAILFLTLPKITFLRENLISTTIAIFCPILVINTVFCLIYWYPYDFASDITIYQYITPLLCSTLIFLSLFIKYPFAVEIGTLLSSILAVTVGDLTIIFFPELSYWLNQSLTIFILWTFSICWRSICGLNPLPQIEGITISGGIFFLYLLGFAPFILGNTAIIILAGTIISYLYSHPSPLGIKSSPLIGFIFGWLGLISYQEYLLPCFIIFSMCYFLELFVSLIRKLTFLPQYQEIAYNTIFVRSFISGIPSSNIIHALCNINILLLIFGLLQIQSKDEYSLPVFAAIITAWQLYRINNWQQSTKTLKETNQEILQGITTTFHQLFSQEKSDKKDKK